MTDTSAPDPADPIIALAQRQLAMLGDLAVMAMAVSRHYAAAAAAAAHAVEAILADEFWQPETGRARALAGARDAADGFQKVSRALRLTLRLEMTTAETLRDLRAGVAPAGAAAVHPWTEVLATPSAPERRSGARPAAGPSPRQETPDRERTDYDVERLVEFDRPDRLPRGAFGETVDEFSGDIGVSADWKIWSIGGSALKETPPIPGHSGRGECRPPGYADRAGRPPP